jgi:hypothetical protein
VLEFPLLREGDGTEWERCVWKAAFPTQEDIVVLLRPEAEELGEELLAAMARELYRPVLDVARCDAQTGPLVLDRVHGRNGERPALQLLDRGLLVGDGLNEKLATHEGRAPDVIQRVHGIMEAHVPDDGVGLNVDLELAVGPGDLAGNDRRVVGALLRGNGQVDTVGEVVAIVEGRLVIVVDIFR